MALQAMRPRTMTPANGFGVFLRPSVPSTPVDDFYAGTRTCMHARARAHKQTLSVS
jgi:hypothetical protein